MPDPCLTLSALSSGSSSVKNSLLGYGIWQPANTLERKITKRVSNLFIFEHGLSP